jgi:putative ABC transport system substrate-binding protein
MLDLPRVATWRSNIGGQRAVTNDCRSSRPILTRRHVTVIAAWCPRRDERAGGGACHRLRATIFNVRAGPDIDDLFATLATERPDALYVSPDALFFNERDRIVALAARQSIPAVYADRESVEAGGLLSYGASRTEAYQQAGSYVGRILKGEEAGDLPVVLPTKYPLVINLNTARALGLTIPDRLLALADEVIQ